MRATLAAAALSLFVGGSAAAQSPTAVMNRAVAAYEKVKTVRATFEQTLTNPLTGSTMVSRGELLQRRPNQLSIRFTDPAGDRVVADGKAVWVYVPSSAPNQVLKLPIGTNAAGALDLAAQFLESPATRYTITGEGAKTLDGRSTQELTLIPRTPMQFTRASIWVDGDGIIRQLQLTEAGGVTRTVRFTSLKLNGSVPASSFSFTPPPGVKVFDQTRR